LQGFVGWIALTRLTKVRAAFKKLGFRRFQITTPRENNPRTNAPRKTPAYLHWHHCVTLLGLGGVCKACSIRCNTADAPNHNQFPEPTIHTIRARQIHLSEIARQRSFSKYGARQSVCLLQYLGRWPKVPKPAARRFVAGEHQHGRDLDDIFRTRKGCVALHRGYRNPICHCAGCLLDEGD